MPTPDQRQARRLWIAAHHPDRGGDPTAFVAGLVAFGEDEPHDPARPRVTVVRSRTPVRAVRRLARRITKARRRRTHRGSI